MNQEEAREHLLKHSRSDKNGRFPSEYDLEARLTNPLCGDHVELKVKTTDDKVEAVGFSAQACAICSASASILAEKAVGMKMAEFLSVAERFEKSVTESQELPWPKELEAFSCFEHLRVNPARRMCALLPFVVFRKSLK